MHRICISAWESKALEICTGYALVHGIARHWKYVQDMHKFMGEQGTGNMCRISAWESKALEICAGLVHGRARHWKYVQDVH